MYNNVYQIETFPFLYVLVHFKKELHFMIVF